MSNYEWIIRKRTKLNQSLVRGRFFNVRGITNDYIFSFRFPFEMNWLKAFLFSAGWIFKDSRVSLDWHWYNICVSFWVRLYFFSIIYIFDYTRTQVYLLRSYANEISVLETSVTGFDICWYGNFVSTRKTTKWGLASVKFLLKDNLKNEPSYGVVKVNSEERKQTMRCEESVR